MDNETLQAMKQLLQEQKQELKQDFNQMLVAEREHTSKMIEDSIRPLRESIVTLESMPHQIRLIAEGHTGIADKLETIETRLDRIEDQLENAVIVKAAR